jgi:HPt (histidine-containing phosphotransfer) domain-containing protein
MNKHDKSYNLDKLIEFIGNDEAAVSSMVGIFLQSTPELLGNINDSLQKSDITAVGKYAHMLKPSLDIFGLDKAFELIKKIETIAKSSENHHLLPDMIRDLKAMLDRAQTDIRADYPAN